jgi:phi13 family phage major tail protein
MADKNKVLFGFSDLYIGIMTEDAQGEITMGSPYHQKGAVGYSPEENTDSEDFYADNIPYYTSYSTGVYEGDLEVAKFDDQFKLNFLGYRQLADGGLAQIKGAQKPKIYMAFEIQGDVQARRCIFYGGSLGAINRSYKTIEDNKVPDTETLSTKFIGDNATGITKVTYNPGDSGYDTLFTNPPAPALPDDSES